ncbi:Alpha/Beta hydrolase protein [Schizophyllum amplum]|uniref:Alpha/Beta hydrolase protein n=1 Tax=Schizophyllum amplum TaxID=97359 RepID=A0A550CT05_9AGAR|nr:Alpha/Beta hydrolase protein [Auriculariopsis ampla]
MTVIGPANFDHRHAILSTGRKYHFVDQVPVKYEHGRTPTLLCVHGFPDLWYGWRNQISPWCQAGYRVVVPDMLGYGETDRPQDPAEYTMRKLCDDLAALLDLLDVRKAVLIGHDWGAYTVGRFALWHPHRLLALVTLSIPYVPRSPTYVPLHEIIKRYPNWAYQGYLASPQSTAFIEAREQQYYVQEFRKGMHGPTNYYRTTRLRFDEEETARLPYKLPDDLSVLLLWGTKDRSTPPQAVAASRKFVPRLQDVALEGCGHWLMIEAPDIVTTRVLEWLQYQCLKPPQAKL